MNDTNQTEQATGCARLDAQVQERADSHDEKLHIAHDKFATYQMQGEGIGALLRTAREDALGNIRLHEEHLYGIGAAIDDVLSDMAEQFEHMANRYEVLLAESRESKGGAQ